MVVIREMHSCVVRGQVTKIFHAGGALQGTSQSNRWAVKKEQLTSHVELATLLAFVVEEHLDWAWSWGVSLGRVIASGEGRIGRL